MSVPSFDIEGAALALADDQRADLAYKLLRSLPPPPGSDVDSPEFPAELDRRMAAYEAGETTADDWDVVAARLKQSLHDRRAS